MRRPAPLREPSLTRLWEEGSPLLTPLAVSDDAPMEVSDVSTRFRPPGGLYASA